MYAAFSTWEERIAPLLDVAPELTLVAKTPGTGKRVRKRVAHQNPEAMMAILLGHGASLLVCGAVSRPFHEAFAARGITLHSFVTGTLVELVHAWRTGRLGDARFRMPGCDKDAGPPDRNAACRCPLCGRTVANAPHLACAHYRCPNCRAPMVRA